MPIIWNWINTLCVISSKCIQLLRRDWRQNNGPDHPRRYINNKIILTLWLNPNFRFPQLNWNTKNCVKFSRWEIVLTLASLDLILRHFYNSSADRALSSLKPPKAKSSRARHAIVHAGHMYQFVRYTTSQLLWNQLYNLLKVTIMCSTIKNSRKQCSH